MSLSRRTIMSAGFAFMALPAAFAREPVLITPEQAGKDAASGKIKLVDVRTPQEWNETGIPLPAHAISMHQKGFLEKLNKLVGNDKTAPVAFICATGSRSGYVVKELKKLGYTNVMSVAGGMLGTPAQKGWISLGLPVKKP